MEAPRIVLASASPRRRELLAQVGIHAEVRPTGADEHCRAKTPAGIVKALSRRKAENAAAGLADGTVVIGADTIVVLDGEVLGKPKDREDAVRMIRELSGRAHRVYTGVTLIEKGRRSVTFAERTDVHVREMTDGEISAYVDSGEPMDKAGAYGIQGRFAAYVSGIRGDYANVVGLPLCAVMKIMEEWNIIP